MAGRPGGDWLGDGGGRLESSLLAGLPRKRWFAGKARRLDWARIAERTAAGVLPGGAVLAIVEVGFADGGTDLYLLPLAVAEEPGRVPEGWELAGIDGLGTVYDALADEATGRALLGAIVEGRELPTGAGVVRGSPTSALDAALGGADVSSLPVGRGTAEQSNSALRFGDRLILKVFRRLEGGLNPDLEIGRFLSGRTDFDRIPPTAGALELVRAGGEPITLAILQGFVSNEGTGWEHALEELAGYYRRAAGEPEGTPPADAASRTLLELAASTPPPDAQAALGAYLDAVATLGRRTGELHRALASEADDPAFAPEPLDAAGLRKIAADVRAQVESALAALRENLDRLPAEVAEPARVVLDGAPGLLGLLDALPSLRSTGRRIRVHGDYHLGQVLRTGDDFVLLDFEGEPARPLASRREKFSPLKDVVGMLRSFDYAAFAALFAHAGGDADAIERLAPWARAWSTWTSTGFLKAYLLATTGAPFLPGDPMDFERLLRVLLLEKALYELQYELNNRPGWVRIPLRGIQSLIEAERGPAARTNP